MMKKALITGITGQDGSYLAEFLLEKGYEVHGMKRRASSFNTARIDHLFSSAPNFYLHYGELTDSSNIIRLVQEIQPDEIYNLGAQSHVKVSFDSPEYTADVDGLGALRLLEAIRILRLEHKTIFTRLPLPSFLAMCARFPKQRRHLSIPALHMPAPSCMPIGYASITVNPMVYMHAMAFCSIMNPPAVVAPLSPAKSPVAFVAFCLAFLDHCVLATWMHCVIGVTQGIMWKCNG